MAPEEALIRFDLQTFGCSSPGSSPRSFVWTPSATVEARLTLKGLNGRRTLGRPQRAVSKMLAASGERRRRRKDERWR